MHNTILVFYSAAALAAAASNGGSGATLDDVIATREALSSETGDTYLLRDADVFVQHLNLEGGRTALSRIVLLGDDGDSQAFQVVRETFEAAGIEVIDDEIRPASDKAPAEGSAELAGLNALKADATALGLHFASNIGEAALRARVDQEKSLRAQLEESALEAARATSERHDRENAAAAEADAARVQQEAQQRAAEEQAASAASNVSETARQRTASTGSDTASQAGAEKTAGEAKTIAEASADTAVGDKVNAVEAAKTGDVGKTTPAVKAQTAAVKTATKGE